MGEMIQFKRPDGTTCPGYLVNPKPNAEAHGFVVIQEWWGVNDQIKKTADRLAEAGYQALVPDLYRGKVTTATEEATHLMEGLNFPDAAEQDIRGAVLSSAVFRPPELIYYPCGRPSTMTSLLPSGRRYTKNLTARSRANRN